MEKRQSLQQVVLGKLDSDMQKNEPGPLSYTIHKNKLKMDERHKCKTGSHQNPKGKSGKNLFDLSSSNFLLNTSPEVRKTKVKMNYWDLIKIKSFWGAWVAQLVKRPTSAQVMISRLMIKPHVRLCADSSEPEACFRFCVSLSLCPSLAHVLSLSPSKINKH